MLGRLSRSRYMRDRAVEILEPQVPEPLVTHHKPRGPDLDRWAVRHDGPVTISPLCVKHDTGELNAATDYILNRPCR